ncbi:hypothetical protein [Helicobacter muridarum]|nr:hypothetical protein [Helicobacter muridarum]STQ86169.1 Uncharacterised protein [Helicobacter muridarum]
MLWGGGVEPSEHNSIKNNPIIPTNIAQSQTKDIIIKRNGNVHKIYLKIPLFCIPIINKHISYSVRLDLIYSDAHGEWIGNFIQWTKIMLLIVPIEMGLSLHSLDSTKSSNSTSPIMFDDEFLRQDDLVTHKNKQ